MHRRRLFAAASVFAASLLATVRGAVARPAGPPAGRADLVWDDDNWEATYPYSDIDCSLSEGMDPGEVMRVGRAVRLPDIWIARDSAEKLHECATYEEAKAIADDALAAADRAENMA